MLDIIGSELASAIGVSFSPLPLIMLMILLTTENGKTVSIPFVIGWYLAAFSGMVLLALLGTAGGMGDESATGTTGINYLGLAVAFLFLWLSYSQFKKRPKPGEEAEMPGWLAQVDKFGPFKDFLAAFLLIILNPKNIPLLSVMGLGIANTSLDLTTKIITAAIVAVFCAIIPLSIVLVNLVAGERAAGLLDAGRHWLVQNNAVIMGALFAFLGISQLGEAISGIF